MWFINCNLRDISIYTSSTASSVPGFIPSTVAKQQSKQQQPLQSCRTCHLLAVRVRQAQYLFNSRKDIIAYFIATDASDSQIAASVTNNTGFKVNFTRQQGYVLINGIKESQQPMKFQLGVASALSGEQGSHYPLPITH